jgi:hypothetical protein
LVELFEQCTLAASLDQQSGVPGQTIVVTGGPFGETWDNLVKVDGTLADVVETTQTERLDESGETVEAEACERCDACRERAAGTCNRCYQACGNCVETLSFVVPDVSGGDTSVLILNGNGGSEPAPFTVDDTTSSGTSGTPTTATGTTTTAPTSTGTTPTSAVTTTGATTSSTTGTTTDTADTGTPTTPTTGP